MEFVDLDEKKKRRSNKNAMFVGVQKEPKVTYTTGDPDLNIAHFNRMMGTDFGDSSSSDGAVGDGGGEAVGESLNLTEGRDVRRYFIRPQNIYCSNKSEILQSLVGLGDENCSVYTLKNLDDNDNTEQLTTHDIIYYYDDGILYDKNKVKVMDYDLSIKHEEERRKFDVDATPESTFDDNYEDRITEDMSNEFALDFDNAEKFYEDTDDFFPEPPLFVDSLNIKKRGEQLREEDRNREWYINHLAGVFSAAELANKPLAALINMYKRYVLDGQKRIYNKSKVNAQNTKLRNIDPKELKTIKINCPTCGTKLNDAGECPQCDLGDTNESLNESIEQHDTLNTKLWTGNKLKKAVSNKVKDIADEFIQGLQKDEIELKVDDIILLGSNCSYNYTDDSDLDVHIIANTKSIRCPEKILNALYSAYRRLFDKKFDIDFYGIQVELYIETESVPRVTNGCYSVLKDKQLKEPEYTEVPNYDKKAVKESVKKQNEKYKEIKNKVKESESSDSKTTHEGLINSIDKYIEDVYALRKESLANEGEWGTGNLIFKEIRNANMLDDLKDMKNKIKSDQLSLSEGYLTTDEYNKIREELSVAFEGHNFLLEDFGNFRTSKVREIDARRIVGNLRSLDCVENAHAIPSGFDFSADIWSTANGQPKSAYVVTGTIKLD